MDRIDLFKKIADYLFASYRWGCMNSPVGLEPKPHGLTVDLLEYQRLNHPVYQRFCEKNGRISRGASVFDYPPVPVEFFENSDFRPFAEQLVSAEFHECSSKGAVRIHQFRDIGLLQRSSIYAFTLLAARTMQLKIRVFSMFPAYGIDPHSMLAYRYSSFVELFGSEGSDNFGMPENGLKSAELIAALKKAAEDNIPVQLMGTDALCRELLDALQEQCIVSCPGSCVHLADTLDVSDSTRRIREALSQKLGIPLSRFYSEFSMLELSSQGYEICAQNTAGELPADKLFVFPNWIKCFIFNPDNLSQVLPENPGKIAFLDLCNLDSAAFILTNHFGKLCQLPEKLRACVPGHPKFALKLLNHS